MGAGKDGPSAHFLFAAPENAYGGTGSTGRAGRGRHGVRTRRPASGERGAALAPLHRQAEWDWRRGLRGGKPPALAGVRGRRRELRAPRGFFPRIGPAATKAGGFRALRRAKGRREDAYARCYRPPRFVGTLRGTEDGRVTMELEGQATVRLALDDVERARLVPQL